MIVETLIGGGVLYYIAKNLVQIDIRLKPHAIAQTIDGTKQTFAKAKERVQKQLVSESEWHEQKANEKARELYDRTIGKTFDCATNEEKDTILAIFRKYMPSDK